MANITGLTTTTAFSTADFVLRTQTDGTSQKITLSDFQRNFTFVGPTGLNHLYLGAGAWPSIVVNKDSLNVGVGSGYFIPSTVLHVSGDNPEFLVQANDSGDSVGIHISGTDSNKSWYMHRAATTADFSISGNNFSKKYLTIEAADGDIMLGTGGAPQTDLHLYALDAIRLQGGESSYIHISGLGSHSSIQSETNGAGDLYINSGYNDTYIGKSGVMYVNSSSVPFVRIGNTGETTSDSILYVINTTGSQATKSTALFKSPTNPNIRFTERNVAGNTGVLAYESQKFIFTQNSSYSTNTISNSSVVFDLSSKYVGIGGVSPNYSLDITGSNSSLVRFQADAANPVIKFQNNSPSASTILTAYATGNSVGHVNRFMFGLDGSDTLNYQMVFNTGATDSYVAANNVATLNQSGDWDVDRYHTSKDNFCRGKFIQFHTHQSNVPTGADIFASIVSNAVDIEKDLYVPSLETVTQFPHSGRLIGIDLKFVENHWGTAQTVTGFLVFNKFKEPTIYDSGAELLSGTNFFSLWGDGAYKTLDDIIVDLDANYAYMTGIFRPSAGVGTYDSVQKFSVRASDVSNPFLGLNTGINFDRGDYGVYNIFFATNTNSIPSAPFVPPASTSSIQYSINTIAEYFIETNSDTTAMTL
jgi:hypothetical protein